MFLVGCNAGNQCDDVATCNVCSACCRSYITNGQDCDNCVQENCALTGIVRIEELWYNSSRQECDGAAAGYSYADNTCTSTGSSSKLFKCSDDGYQVNYTYWPNTDCSGSSSDHQVHTAGVCSQGYTGTGLNYRLECIVSGIFQDHPSFK
jgi:hypothetical protein